MSKRIKVVLMCVALSLLLTGCGIVDAVGSMVQDITVQVEEKTHMEIISECVEVDVTGGEESIFYDDHGGFHGDGMTFAIITFDDSGLIPAIENNLGWRELPLSENLTRALYGKTYEDGEMLVTYGPLITDEAGESRFPNIKNGYYYFFDRRNEELAPGGHYDDSLLFDRASYNFYASIYDTDTDTLYFTAFDT